MPDGVERMRKSHSPFLLVASLWAFWTFSVKQRHMKEMKLILEKLDSHFQQSQRSVLHTSVFCCGRNPLKSPWPTASGDQIQGGKWWKAAQTQWLWAMPWSHEWLVVISCLGTADSLGSSWGLQRPAGVVEHFWPGWALAQTHISMTLQLILYTGKLKTDVAWLVAYLCAPQIWKWSMSVNWMQQQKLNKTSLCAIRPCYSM